MSLCAAALLTVCLHACVAIAQHFIASQTRIGAATVLYYLVMTALVACYCAVIQRIAEHPTRRDWLVIAAVPLIIEMVWLVPRPILSIDAYTYVVNAAQLNAGVNPYLHPNGEADGTALGRQLVEYGWQPKPYTSPYGPVWLNLLSVVGPFTGNAALAVRLVKLIAVAATMAVVALVFRVAPASSRSRALVLFWWNPVVIIESAGEGHNDAVMAAGLLLSLWLLRRHAPIAAAGALSAAVLTKWVPVFFLPVCVAYAWRSRLLNWRTVAGAIAVGAAVTAAAYWRLWAGANTFTGIETIGGVRFAASVTGSLVAALANHHVVLMLLRGAAVSVLVAAIIYVTARTHVFHDLARGWALIALTFVLLAAPLYWPWYVVMPIALLAVIDDVPAILVLTATSRIVAPIELLRVREVISRTTGIWLTTVVALWLPLGYLAWLAIRRSSDAGPGSSRARSVNDDGKITGCTNIA